MIASRFNKPLAAAIFGSIVICAAAAFASRYASGQAYRYLAEKTDTALGSPARRSVWTELREGPVLGRSTAKQGNGAYVVVIRRLGGEYRMVASVDGDGKVLASASLGASNGFVYAKRLASLFSRKGSGGKDGDASPLDVALQPMVIDAIEMITALERERTESAHAK